eukprot:COSAG01_NODE_630_length_14689_cov_177.423098_10_plen_283_part_00
MGINQRQGALDGGQTSVGERLSPLLGHVSSACPPSAVPDPGEVALHPPPSPLQLAQPLSQPHTVAPPHRTASHPRPAPPRRTAAPRPRRTPGLAPVLGRRGARHLTKQGGMHHTGAGGDNGTGKIQKRRGISVDLIMIDPMISPRTRSIPSAAGASTARSPRPQSHCERLPRVRCIWSGTVQHQSGSQTGSRSAVCTCHVCPQPPRLRLGLRTLLLRTLSSRRRCVRLSLLGLGLLALAQLWGPIRPAQPFHPQLAVADCSGPAWHGHSGPTDEGASIPQHT